MLSAAHLRKHLQSKCTELPKLGQNNMEEDSRLDEYPNVIKVGVLPTVVMSNICFKRLLSLHPDGFSMSVAASQCSHDLGMSVSLAMIVLDIIGIPWSNVWIVPRNHTDYGTKTNRSWTGALAEIRDTLYDTSLPVFSPLQERWTIVDFSVPVQRSAGTFATRWAINL